jgi:hypothetical protein
MRKTTRMFLISAIAAVFTVGIATGTPYQTSQTSDSDSLSPGEVAQLLRLIDVNKTGKITKQQWMDFVATEFDRLDTKKSGVLDSAELSRSRLRVSSFVFPPSQKHSARK